MIPARFPHPGNRGLTWNMAHLLFLTLAAVLVSLPGAFAQSSTDLDEKARRISEQLRCPTCQALSVQDSDASFSVQIRDKVRAMLQEGQSEETIIAYFVSRYGQWILRAPEKKGFGLVVWVLPLALIALMGLWIGRIILLNARMQAPALEAAPLSETQLLKIDADLKRFEEED